MPRSLALFAASLACLAIAACSSGPKMPADAQVSPELSEYRRLGEWFSLQDDVESMSAEEVQAALDGIARPDNPDQIFYFALLNQRVESYGNWTLARDKFRELRSVPGLTAHQYQLASILERYNQSRINWYKRRELVQDENELLAEKNRSLRNELVLTESERVLLEEKIQAITDLERAMSTRRE